MFAIIAQQMLAFAAMLALGAYAAHRNIVKRESVSDVIAVSLKVLLPIMLFSFVYQGSTPQNVFAHVSIIPLTLALYALLVTATWLLARLLKLDGARCAAWRMTFIFGNTGFIGLPVLTALFSESGAVMLALFMTVDQAIFWTYGLWTAKRYPVQGSMTDVETKATVNAKIATTTERVGAKAKHAVGNKGAHGIMAGSAVTGARCCADSNHALQLCSALLTFARNFANPNIIAVFGALVLVLMGVQLPVEITSVLSTVGAAATPVCMLCLGAMFYFADVSKLLNVCELVAGVGVKMLAIPLAVGLVLGATPLPWDVKVSFTVLAAMPATTLVPLCVQANGGEGEYASVLSVATIVFSVITIPVVAALLWGAGGAIG